MHVEGLWIAQKAIIMSFQANQVFKITKVFGESFIFYSNNQNC